MVVGPASGAAQSLALGLGHPDAGVGIAGGSSRFGFESLGNRPGLLFAYVLLLDLGLLALAWEEKRMLPLEPVAGGAVFLLLTIWTARHLNFDLFYWGLGLVFGFALGMR